MTVARLHPAEGLRRICLAGVSVVLLPGLVSACAELGLAGPDVDLVTKETHPALAGLEELPDLPELMDRADSAEDLDGMVADWEDSWNRGLSEGRQVRMQGYDRAVPLLARKLDRAELKEAVDGLVDALSGAGNVDVDRLPEVAREELARAKELGQRAEAGLENGSEPEEILRATLEAGDALRALSPQSVARETIRMAELSVATAEQGGPADEGQGGTLSGGNAADAMPAADLERAQRLARGAERAFERGEYRKAIQRAFYAHQIAENGRTN